MKNEDKARKIANNCSTHIVGAEVSDETYISTEPDCYRAAIEMAKWKDKQFVKELCKVLEFSASPVDMEDEINNLIQKYENQ